MKRIKNLITLSAIALFATVAPGCGGSSDEVTELCERFEECDFLGEGTTTESCIDGIGSEVDNLSESQEEQFREAMNDCLSKSSCDAFGQCFLEFVNGG